ncbi:hypothetical protein ACQ0QQ_21255 [Lysinibacillus sphaericus]
MTLTLLLLILGVIAWMMAGKKGNRYQIKWIHSLKKYSWFANPWLAGLFLFVINLFLFGMTGLILIALSYLMIPYFHLVIMMLAVIISILVWKSIAAARSWTKGERVRIALTGSSFYLCMAGFFYYQMVSYVPQFPGDDTFMATLGFMVGLVVTAVAFLTCLSIFLFTRDSFSREA